jgi:1,4-dihydroxy-6-naphthoate synthase
MSERPTLIRVGHSPDPDDAFMFHALANDKIDTGRYRFQHELQDIETLNRRAFAAELELTAVSSQLCLFTDRYALCLRASVGDNYGPMVVTRELCSLADLRGKTIAVPGTLTTAFLALNLCLQGRPQTPTREPHRTGSAETFRYEVHPFDEILNIVARGEADAGLIIHEGQLTYAQQGLKLVVDLGKWWMEQTGLPLPLGANAIRKDLGPQTMRDVTRLLKQASSTAEHRSEG